MLRHQRKVTFRRVLILALAFILLVGFSPSVEAGVFSKIGKGISKIFGKFFKKEADDVAGKGAKETLEKKSDDIARKSSKAKHGKAGKKDFYPKGEEALKSKGYNYYDGDKAIKGKGKAHRRKPDYIAEKDNNIIIGESKSPNEQPTSSSWRHRQPNDSEEMAKVRADVAAREKAGELNKEVGGHEIIIRGQIPDYAKNKGKTYDMPINESGKTIKGGYTVDSSQAKNVEQALKNCGKKNYKIIDNGNGSITYIFDI